MFSYLHLGGRLYNIFRVSEILFCLFVAISVKNLLKCSPLYFGFVIVFPSSIRQVGQFIFFLFFVHITSLIPIQTALQLFLFSSKYLCDVFVYLLLEVLFFEFNIF